MALFLIFAVVLLVVALLFVVPELIRHDSGKGPDPDQANIDATNSVLATIDRDAETDLVEPHQLQAIRKETEAMLLAELNERNGSDPKKQDSPVFRTLSTVIIALLVPAVVVLVYAAVGEPAALLGTQQNRFVDQHARSGQELPSVEEMVTRLQRRLEQNPDDVNGWFTLARTYMSTRRYDLAVDAMERVYSIAGDNPDVLARYADAIVMANAGTFTEPAKSLLGKAMELDGNHVQSLWMSGMSALKELDYDSAIDYFHRARANLSNPEEIARLDQLIAAAGERGATGVTGLNEAATQTESKIGGRPARVQVEVRLSDQLQASVQPQDQVYVFARAASGPPMPLAVSRHRVMDLPLKVILDDDMAMTPTLKMSAFDQWIVVARVSKSGQPTAHAGDLEGKTGLIESSTQDSVEVIIDRIVSGS